MDTLRAINTRRSIRSWLDEPMPREDVQKIIAAAQQAPSAGNQQPWHFYVTNNKGALGKVPALNQYAPMAPNAAVGILLCGDLSREKFPGFWVQDCSAAAQNLLLAAHAMGYGAVWTGIHPEKEREKSFADLFGLPENMVPLGLFLLGKPKKVIPPHNRFNPEYIDWTDWE